MFGSIKKISLLHLIVSAINLGLLGSMFGTSLFPLRSVEDNLTDLKMKIRGSEKSDSSIIALAVTGDDINHLGGFPIPRLYYAATLRALHELGAKQIGLDVVFEKPHPLYPEYDTLLADAIRAHGNVVLSAYAPDSAVVSIDGEMLLLSEKLISSFRLLSQSCDNVCGLTNLLPSQAVRSVPMQYAVEDAIRDTTRGVYEYRSSFAALLADVDGIKRMGIPHSLPIRLNYAGDASAYRMYSLVSFLRAHDSLAQGYDVTFPVASFRGATVLIGVVAEGRSQFFETPFDDAFPALLVHAAAIDTWRQEKEFSSRYSLLVILFCTIVACFVVWFFVRRQATALTQAAVLVSFVLFLLLTNVFAFSLWRIDAPVVIPTFALLIAVVQPLIMIWLQRVGRQKEIESQLFSVRSQLERKSAELEAERSSNSRASTEAQDAAHRRVESYEEEIVALKFQLKDLSSASLPILASSEASANDEIVFAEGSPMKNIVQQLASVAREEVTVLLTGESGTGKELAAKMIHRLGNRSGGEFVAVNCGALSETLLESELFGYERGAFTGADRRHIGRFERASGGTLFLDEIAETSEAFQIKLLRVLQEGEIERVGGSGTMKVDVRIVAATNKDLQQRVAEKKFREDLFYRIHVFPISLPPLRERRMDIPVIVSRYLSKHHAGMALTESVATALSTHDWRGNVRELESVLTHAAILAKGESRRLIRLQDLPTEIQHQALKQHDVGETILILLRQRGFARGAIVDVAQELGGMDRGTVTEYFRGLCFLRMSQSSFSIDAAASLLAATDDAEVLKRVKAKLKEYLSSLQSDIHQSLPIEKVVESLHHKYKNLPKRYHAALEELARYYHSKAI